MLAEPLVGEADYAPEFGPDEGEPDQSEPDVDLGDPGTWTRHRDPAAATFDPEREERGEGPWDGGRDYPPRDRVSLGSLLIPARPGFDVQVAFDEEGGGGVLVAVVRGESALQLVAFAAPKSSGLWDDVRREIAAEIVSNGGSSRELDGRFGAELHAQIVEDSGSSGAAGGRHRAGSRKQPIRFLGADGPRWFLRGVITGPAAVKPELARPFEEIFADVVVVRGDHPAPPRSPLAIVLPEQAQEEQVAGQGPLLSDPFRRGPEITETR